MPQDTITTRRPSLRQPEMVIDMTAVPGILMPTDCFSIAAEEIALAYHLNRQAKDHLRIGINIEGVHRAIEFAHETGLAIVLPQDN